MFTDTSELLLPAIEKMTRYDIEFLWHLPKLCGYVLSTTLNCSRLSSTTITIRNTAVLDAVLPAIDKLTVPRNCLQPLHPDTGAQLHLFYRNVSYRCCVDRLPPAIRHVQVLRLLLHVYVWEDSGRSFRRLTATGTLGRWW